MRMYHKLVDLYENVEDTDFIYSIEAGNGFMYSHCTDLDYFIEQYWSLPELDRTYQEIFQEHKPLKVFFDVDISKDDKNKIYKDTGKWGISPSDVYQEFLLFIADFHTHVLDQYIMSNYCVLDSSDVNGKTSLHLMDQSNHWPDINTMKCYYDKLYNFMKCSGKTYDYMKFIDFGISTKNRNMRMIGSHKAKEPTRVLKPFREASSYKYKKTDKRWFVTHISFDSSELKLKIPPKKVPKVNKKLTSQELLESCKHIINELCTDTATKYSSWYGVGSALYNTLDGSDEGLELFIQFSKLDKENYDEDEIIKLWDRGMSGYNYGTLLYYFNKDYRRIN